VFPIHIVKGTESNGQDKEYKAPFLKNIEKIKNSSPVKIAKGLSGIVEEHLSNFSKDFESKLNAEAKKQVNGKKQYLNIKHLFLKCFTLLFGFFS